MLGGPREASRALIALSRQGGVSIKDRRDEAGPKQQGKPAGKSGKSAGKDKSMSKSQSAPTLVQTGSLSGTARMGGGWARNGASIDLTKYKELLDRMVEMSVDVNFSEKPFFRTALWEATWKNHESIVKLLVARGADISAADYQGRTPLHEAAYYGHLNLVEFFIDRGHPTECVDAFGQTPLFRAADAGRADVVKLLVKRGARTNELDSHHVTAQHVAAFRGLPVLADYLRFNGAHRNRFSLGESSEQIPQRHARGALLSGAALVMK